MELLISARPQQVVHSIALRERSVVVICGDRPFGEAIKREIDRAIPGSFCAVMDRQALARRGETRSDFVFVPSYTRDLELDLAEAEAVLRLCANSTGERFILVASATVYGASFRNPGLMGEHFPAGKQSSLAAAWTRTEELAHQYLARDHALTILRCAPVLAGFPGDPITQLLKSRTALIPAGYDPAIQLLSPGDLAQAIAWILKSAISGTFNVAPDEPISLRQALCRAGVKRIPVPSTFLRLREWSRRRSQTARVDYQRYPWTISNRALKRVGFQPECSSVGGLAEWRRAVSNEPKTAPANIPVYDSFGMDKGYIDFFARTLFKFLADWYWRVEVAGIEHVPPTGRAMLVGIHRGFMPWDGVMALHVIARDRGRYPRFLIHPGLVKFPFLANFMTKLGGIVACKENARWVLEHNEVLGVFPEGIHGAFAKYSQAYRIQHFHRHAFVKIALHHRTPIIPFVTVGSAEIFPVLATIKSRLWTNYSEWPAFPITPTFPLLPLPLPSKWHTRFLDAWHIENEFGPDAVSDPKVVEHISIEVKNRMQREISRMLSRRRSLFFGSIFSDSGA